ncbi:ATP-binding cassette sub-family C member 5-like [Lytechinus pictus]|uniref:ATP-binding cassette sub-family C member 5-like n=1 Tax=Lytechinus pictus TaxID=7653 RepID=UPI0030BA20B8
MMTSDTGEDGRGISNGVMTPDTGDSADEGIIISVLNLPPMSETTPPKMTATMMTTDGGANNQEEDFENNKKIHPDIKGRNGFKYTGSMKVLIPVRFKPKNEVYSPMDHSGLLSYVWISWMSSLFFKAYKKTLEYSDLGQISKYDRGDYNADRLERLWKEEVDLKGSEEKASINRVALRFVRTRQIVSAAVLVVALMASFITSVILVQRLLEYTEEEEVNLGHGIVLVVSIFLLQIIRITGDVFSRAFNCRTATRLRSGMLTMAFRKLAHLRSLKQHSVGEIVNVCANDSQRLFNVCVVGNFLISSPTLLLATLIATQFIVGTGALIGTLVTFIFFVPLQAVAGKIISNIRIKCIETIDVRVQKMNELVTYIKLIKMYAWEIPFTKTIRDLRRREKSHLEKAGMLQSFSLSNVPIIPSLASVLSIIIHISMGNSLTAAEAFTLVSLLNVCRAVIGPTPFAVRMLAESTVALDRLKSIMTMEKAKPNETLEDTSTNMAEIRGGEFGWDSFSCKQDDTREDTPIETTPEDKNQNGIINVGFSSEPEIIKNGLHTAADSNGIHGQISDVKHRDCNDITNKSSSKIVPVLFDLNFDLKKGKLVGICGPVGSGKSSLINAILGQMEKVKGSCKVRGTFAYAAQEAWIFNATVQENILFGSPMDQERYAMVLEVCSLKQDLAILTNGDQTEIGERGINLSGGQKQRVSLARAVYADHDVYLLDDPLSAVDAHVGEHIFKKCIKGALSNKTILFVTHQLQYLQDCDSVAVMMDGHIREQGTHSELMTQKGEYDRLITTHCRRLEDIVEETEDEEEDDDDEVFLCPPQAKREHRRISSTTVAHNTNRRRISSTSISNFLKKPVLTRTRSSTSSISSFSSFDDGNINIDQEGHLTTSEERSHGSPSGEDYLGYINAMGGFFALFSILFTYIVVIGMLTVNNWWLAYWIEKSNNRPYNETVDGEAPTLVNDPNLWFYMLVYGGTLLLIFIVAAFKSVIYMKFTLNASSSLHDNLFRSVIRSPVSFFDTTPTGRILNRFSKDIDELDVMLPINMEMSLNYLLTIVASLITISIVFPYFICAVIPVALVFALIMVFYRKGVNDLKQLENLSRSPWFSHIGSTAMGLPTIHAYGKTNDVITKFVDLLNTNAYPLMLFRMANRWAGARLELLVIFVVTITNLLVVLYHGKIPPSTAGFAVSYAMQLTGMFQLTMNMLTDTEARFFSAQRIMQYIRDLKPEASETTQTSRPEKEWPSQGEIRFHHFRMRYRENLPLVLKNVTCSIRGGERIGIVGRTGSGKSSLSVALFRLVEGCDKGSISIDGVDISGLGLFDLRSKMSIIPQDPVLFIGTVRYNLDPFGEKSDSDLWQALEKAYLKEKISSLEGSLEAPVTEGGDNFSVGERQLMCMARALLRNSKILFLDEATAAIDTETDSLIQQTIRTAFSDCTTLTIAHRLNTVLDSDKILVMKDGMVAEFDSPGALRANPKSLFSGMLSAIAAETQDT